MDIANRCADDEELLCNERPRSPEDTAFDGPDLFDSGRRGGSDRRRKRKHRGFNEADGANLVAAEFTGSRDGGCASKDASGSHARAETMVNQLAQPPSNS